MSDWQKEWKDHNFWRTFTEASIWGDLDDWDSWGVIPDYDEGPEEVEEETPVESLAMKYEEKWDRRDKKRHKAQHGMQMSGKSLRFLHEALTLKYMKIASEKKKSKKKK